MLAQQKHCKIKQSYLATLNRCTSPSRNSAIHNMLISEKEEEEEEEEEG
jgi:hypothetical protein